MDSQVNQVQAAGQTLTPGQIPPKKNRNKLHLFILLTFAAALVILLSTGFLYFKSNNTKTSTSITSQEKKIITLSKPFIKEPEFFSYSLVSKTKDSFFQPPSNRIIKEAEMSKDGKKLYYTFTTSDYANSGTVVIVNQDKSTKEVDFARSNLWSLSSQGILTGGMNKDCYWSNDSTKLACILSESESVNGSGTGRARITVYNTSSDSVYDVLTSDQIAPPEKTRVLTKLGGWLGNNQLLVVQVDGGYGQEIDPADFYSLDIVSKNLNKEFSYRYDIYSDIVIAPSGRQIFFDSISRMEDDKFVKFDLDTKHDSVIISSNVLYPLAPIISEDGSKLVYTTDYDSNIFLMDVHIYDLQTGEEKTLKLELGYPVVVALLDDGKTFIILNNQGELLLYNSETITTDNLGKEVFEVFIGLGYF